MIKYNMILSRTLREHDEEMYDLIQEEKLRQRQGMELIASENFTPGYVLDCLGSVLTNKYSEGQPGSRYYGGNAVIDKVEMLCKKRALEAFNLDPEEWDVNVQPYSGSVANLAVYNALLDPHDTIMGLSLASGGHLTHGHFTDKRKVSISSIFYESCPYHIGDDGLIDYDSLEEKALAVKPRMIICGASAYPRDYDFARFRKICDSVGAYLMCDMAHTSGLIASGLLSSPFEHSDVITSTTHKTLGGPRSGMIFYRKNLKAKIDFSVFPSIQGGPHDNQIGALAAHFKTVSTPAYVDYSRKVIENAQSLSSYLMCMGYKVSSDGTDNHIVLVDLKNKNVSGSKVEKICEMVDISLNKNSVLGDKSPMVPGGVRLGTSALTTRGFGRNDFKKVAEILNDVVILCQMIQEESGKMMVDFVKKIENYENEISDLRKHVNSYMEQFDFY